MVTKIMKVLREWDGSQPEPKMAREILAVCEANGMLPPDKLAHLPAPEMCMYEWEPESKPTIKSQPGLGCDCGSKGARNCPLHG